MLRLVAAVVVVAAAFAAGFFLARDGAGPDVEELRIGETEGPDVVATDASVAFRVLAHDCGILAVAGDHADWLPDGQYCRVRLRLQGLRRPVTHYEAEAQEAVAADGARYKADLNATQISDQPTNLTVALKSLTEFDVWFDVPADAEVTAVHLRAEPDSAGVTIPLGR